jgi:hypothetical protein
METLELYYMENITVLGVDKILLKYETTTFLKKL